MKTKALALSVTAISVRTTYHPACLLLGGATYLIDYGKLVAGL